jgi:hypothetical protein
MFRDSPFFIESRFAADPRCSTDGLMKSGEPWRGRQVDPSRRIGMLYAAVILMTIGSLEVWAYRDPDANPLTRLVDEIWRRFPPGVPVSYRTWYFVTGLFCLGAGLLMAFYSFG